ncbi:6,7-dimethyl-8-ribityllumazine synthase [Candidatus Berkiella aquae]|uniref:6,7-dimethyl-8-ribityllumazine synthase n=1 Tax=Candidatus Berkiella aquae TaxID=295108 RepID=A0A0Q9YWS9_9GAMM|nr:6,7-dimethyl-8-ribityllumazine synthase [Candidatus Berkiella aquae]MCS5710333.1 6,7-dimethyl-8-ribityllumazine synthase [Candidatus Berkiella aquae]
MTTSREIVGDLMTPKGNIAIVASRFNDFMVDKLIDGAKDALLRHGVKEENIDLIKVPGGYEIPLAAQAAAKTGRYSGIITLGVVIRGDTAHFDYVAGGCAQGVMQAQLKTDIPMTLGVLTTENMEQAIARSGSTAGNKGFEAATALIEMMNLLRKIHD